jgi:hypothetical protein
MVQPEPLVQQPIGEGQGVAVPDQTATTTPPPFNSEVQLVPSEGEPSPQTSELVPEQSIELESNDSAFYIAVTTTSEDAIAEVSEEPLNLDPAEGTLGIL